MIAAVGHFGDDEAPVVQEIGRSLANPASPSSSEHGAQCTRMRREHLGWRIGLPPYDARMTADADLIQAVAAGDERALEAALQGGADPNAFDDPAPFRRRPALTVAAENGSTAIVKQLLIAGASPDAEKFREWTPLRAAASFGYADIVRMLLDAGADPNSARDRESIIRAAIAGTRHHPGPLSDVTVTILLERGAKRSPREEPLIVDAVEHRAAPSILRTLLRHGEDPNQRRSDGTPVLIIAARRSSAAAADALIQFGAEVDATDPRGRTALMHAVERGRMDVVTVLLLAGADRQVQAPDGSNAMLLARAWAESTIQFALGSHHVRPERVEAPLSLVRLRPTRYQIRGAPAAFQLWARIIDHTISGLGDDEFETLVTDVQTARSFAERLRTERLTSATDEAWHSMEADDSEVGVVRGCLLNLAYGPRMGAPEGMTQTQVVDLYEDLAGRR
jgi:ankyrin repeat protein